ncbi:MAG: hypothetical protein VKJ06_01045 [Vampirovibrionales bacterium]|nr:hypothetical protein [Vampirovibrionales bacterium]
MTHLIVSDAIESAAFAHAEGPCDADDELFAAEPAGPDVERMNAELDADANDADDLALSLWVESLETVDLSQLLMLTDANASELTQLGWPKLVARTEATLALSQSLAQCRVAFSRMYDAPALDEADVVVAGADAFDVEALVACAMDSELASPQALASLSAFYDDAQSAKASLAQLAAIETDAAQQAQMLTWQALSDGFDVLTSRHAAACPDLDARLPVQAAITAAVREARRANPAHGVRKTWSVIAASVALVALITGGSTLWPNAAQKTIVQAFDGPSSEAFLFASANRQAVPEAVAYALEMPAAYMPEETLEPDSVL